MKTEFRNVIRISSVYIASTIGAAFASGQEIVRFFTRFKTHSFLGVLLSGILFSLVAIAVLDIVYTREIRTSRDLLHLLGGHFGGKVFEGISLTFTLCIYITMIAGAAALWQRLTGFSEISGLIFLTVICTILIFFDIHGVLIISEFLTPLMIAGMLYLGMSVILKSQMVFAPGKPVITDHWLVYAVLYVCYNSILNILVMSSMLPWLKSRKEAVISGVIGGTVLFSSMVILNQALGNNFQSISNSKLPMVELAAATGRGGLFIYSAILTFALLTTAISSGFCCVDRLTRIIKKPRWVIATIVGLLVIPLAKQGFTKIIEKVYPFFGYLGSALVVLLLITWIKLVWKRRKKPAG